MSKEINPNLALIRLHTADHLSYLRANHLLKQYGITIQQALILHYLAYHVNHSINQKNIEIYLGISNPSVTSLMKTMVNKNLVQRLPDRTDARSYLLRLTTRGQQLQSCISNIFSQLSDEINCGLTEDERKQFNYLLDKITSNLTGALTKSQH